MFSLCSFYDGIFHVVRPGPPAGHFRTLGDSRHYIAFNLSRLEDALPNCVSIEQHKKEEKVTVSKQRVGVMK